MTSVLVVGSINMDLVVTASQFPRPGETLCGSHFATFPGGKGANQAVAAARLGASVTMLGCVGDDSFGQNLLAGLQAENIDTQWISRIPGTPTGVASITVCEAENAITVIPGANHALSVEHIAQADAAFAATDVVLAQLETPLPTILAAAQRARLHGKPFILNPAPAVVLPQELLDLVSLLTPNQHELATALDVSGDDWRAQLASLPGRVVMTLGKEGAAYITPTGQIIEQAGFTVRAIDTTGAGDTFNGALAAFWRQGPAAALRLACAAGALSVTRAGAQSGMPTLAELTRFLEQQA
ncbi:ribokinase [Chitinilyticum piscinae]|uniref:Ribokinase n=1 Tax=Chitinilyticum piscinae TaxID=2866724 RepID=A0A8J7FNW1_9NEIS|nr:ribokinase [Chitinilyticum piscinae]MBE9610276.1 ribokinase [Chitinilyticum piscinae]